MDISLYNKRRASYGGSSQVSKLNYANKKLFDRACKEAFDSYIMVINEKEDIDEDTKNESKTKSEENITPLRGLMLEDKLTLEVDQKWFVLPLETNLKPGDVVKVSKENSEDSYWIMVQEDLAERTFKRCVGKKCVTKVSWRDEDDVVYTSWAALRGPTETSIKSESRGNFLFDRGNEKLALWLPDTEYTLGLRRYKYLMVENEVWKIASVDYFTTPGILELALVEAQDNVWTDNKEDQIARDEFFDFTNLFDNDLDFEIETVLNLKPVLLKNGRVITEEKKADFIFSATPNTYTYDKENCTVIFHEIGEYEVSIGYPKMKLDKKYNIELVQEEEVNENYFLIEGNSSIHPFVNNIENYTIKHFINGVENNVSPGRWKYDDSLITKAKESLYNIELEFNGEVGSMDLEYIINGEVVDVKTITVHSVLFG